MNKDSYLDVYDKNYQKFPTRISSKVPVNIAIHKTNKYEKTYPPQYESGGIKPITISSYSLKTDSTLSSSYHSKTTSNSSSSSSTQRTLVNGNEYPFKYDEDDDFSKNNKKEINTIHDFDESVTLGILNSEEYARKLIRASRESFIFDYEKDFKEGSEKDTTENNNNENKSVVNPDESPIFIPDKPFNNKVDISKTMLFKHSNSSNESLSSSSTYSTRSLPRRKSSRKSGKRSSSYSKSYSKKSSSTNNNTTTINIPDYEENSLYNRLEKQDTTRSYSVPKNMVDVKNIDTNSRSNTVARSMIISPTKEEKFFVCHSPKKEAAKSLPSLNTNTTDNDQKSNFKLFDDDDRYSFIYNELASPIVCDFAEYRTLLKFNLSAEPEKMEERKHRSLTRKGSHESRYRSLSKGRSRSRSRQRDISPTRSEGESRYRSLSRNRKEPEVREGRSSDRNADRERRERSRSRDRNADRERRDRSRSRDRNADRERKENKDKIRERRESKSKERRHSSSRHRRSGHRRNKSNTDSINRNNSKGSNYGSPITSNNHSSPLVTNVINNKFSTACIQSSPLNNIYSEFTIPSKPNLPNNNNNNNNNNNSITLPDTSSNLDMLNEFSDLKKFSQEFSGLTILENILNRPFEDDENDDPYSTYNKLTANSMNSPSYPKFSTISRLPSQHRQDGHELRRRNSDLGDLSFTSASSAYKKGHNRFNSDHSRNIIPEEPKSASASNKKNIFNFFSSHKKSKSGSSLTLDRTTNSSTNSNSSKFSSSSFDKMIKSNETLKLKLKSNMINDDESLTDIHNYDYTNSYMNFMNQKKSNYQPQPPQINNIKDYTPLFRINHLNQLNQIDKKYMDFYGLQSEMKNPYDQFNDFNDDEYQKF